MINLSKTVVVLGLVAALGVSGCATSNAVKGGAIGATGGGVLGAVIGKQAGNTLLGAIIGAAVGGTAGVLIGAQMDRQAEEIKQDIKGAKVERVGEGIRITFDSGILFKVDSAMLSATAQSNIGRLAKILNKYPDTNILVEGHTDSNGSEVHNQALSERRSTAVGNYFKSLGVAPARINAMGYGETQPLADNGAEEGRAQNRRVEIAIFANDKLKSAAQAQADQQQKPAQ